MLPDPLRVTSLSSTPPHDIAWKTMEQLSIRRNFPFYQEHNSGWSVDSIPLRFPNARCFGYKPIRVEDEIIIIDIRRNVFKDCLDPPLDTLYQVLQQNPAYPLFITISWNAAAFSRWAPPPWKEPIGPAMIPDSIVPLRPYFNLLVHHVRRWKAFRIFAPLINHMKEEFSRIPRGGASSLNSLVVMDVEQESEIQGLSGILLPLRKYSENFQQLLFLDNRDRTMINVAPDPFSLSIKEIPFLPYERLVSLRLDYKLSAMDAWCILIRTTQLVECVLSSLTGATLLPDHIKATTFGSLQYLKLSNYEADFANFKSTGTVHSLLKRMLTPNLKKLVLKCEAAWDAQGFATFITQSSCALGSLHIIKMGINAQELVSCLALAGDSLTDFLLEESSTQRQYCLTPHFIKHLKYEDPRKHDRDRACLCPNLKVISVGDQSFNGIGTFGNALHTRIGVTPLNEVRILCTDMTRKGAKIQGTDVRSFQRLEREGVRVYLARDPCDGL